MPDSKVIVSSKGVPRSDFQCQGDSGKGRVSHWAISVAV
jgi:hypothetical protein